MHGTVAGELSPSKTPGVSEASATLTVRLVAIRYGARNINLYEFEPFSDASIAASPGSHIDLHLPNALVRQYSLVLMQENPRHYCVAVKLDADSRGGSKFIHESLKVGQQYKISKPRNSFLLEEGTFHSVLIAGGIGITPLWSMAHHLNCRNLSFELHYAFGAPEEGLSLGALQDANNVQLYCSRGNPARRIDIAAIISAAPPEAHFYCCGPAAMLGSFELATATLPADRVHVEHFAAKERAATEHGFVVELAISKKQVMVAKGQTILEALRSAGLDATSSCEQGICGVCETLVLEGVPDHRDSILTEVERISGGTMMICCSGCKGDRLILDL